MGTLLDGGVNEDILVMDDVRKLELAEKHKELGKVSFQNKDTEGAFQHFTRGIKYLILINPKTASPSITERKRSLLSLLQNNTANCHMVKGNWEYAIDLCNSVLISEPENVKALYRRGIAFMEIQEYEKSAQDLYAAQVLEPTNSAVEIKLNTLNARLKKFNQKSGEAMRKLFNS